MLSNGYAWEVLTFGCVLCLIFFSLFFNTAMFWEILEFAEVMILFVHQLHI